jgi:hypothetical protein
MALDSSASSSDFSFSASHTEEALANRSTASLCGDWRMRSMAARGLSRSRDSGSSGFAIQTLVWMPPSPICAPPA